jgi:hypothetical protein
VCPECGIAVDEAGDEDEESSGPPATPAERIGALASGLRSGARGLEIIAVLAALGGVVAGALLVIHTEDGYDKSRPFVGLGIGVMASSLVAGVFNWCVARAVHLFAEYAAVSVSVDLDDV